MGQPNAYFILTSIQNEAFRPIGSPRPPEDATDVEPIRKRSSADSWIQIQSYKCYISKCYKMLYMLNVIYVTYIFIYIYTSYTLTLPRLSQTFRTVHLHSSLLYREAARPCHTWRHLIHFHYSWRHEIAESIRHLVAAFWQTVLHYCWNRLRQLTTTTRYSYLPATRRAET